MAISYVGQVNVPASDNSANQGTTVTFTPPSSQAGDFVLVYVATYLGSQSWSVTTTGGQTWTEEFDETRSGTHALYWCIFDGTWDADPVFTRTGASANDIMGRMVVLRGVHTSPWDVDPSARTAADTNDQDTADFSTNYDGSWAVWGGFEIDNNTCATTNGGAWDNEATTDVGWRVSTLLSMAWCRKYLATAGAAGATTLNYSANDAGGKWSGAIRSSPADQSLTGATFTKAPTFPTGLIALDQALTGSAFTKAPTFPSGEVTQPAAEQDLTGSTYTQAPTFPSSTVQTVYTLTGSTFTSAPSFPTGTASPGAVTLSGAVLEQAPTFPSGSISLGAGEQSLTGSTYQQDPTFPASTAESVYTLTQYHFHSAPTFPAATVIPGAVGLTGAPYQLAPTFPSSTISLAGAPQTLTGSAYTLVPSFPTGTIAAAGPQDLDGAVYALGPTFPTAVLLAGDLGEPVEDPIAVLVPLREGKARLVPLREGKAKLPP